MYDEDTFHQVTIPCPNCFDHYPALLLLSLHDDFIILRAYCEKCKTCYQKETSVEAERRLVREREASKCPLASRDADLKNLEPFRTVQ